MNKKKMLSLFLACYMLVGMVPAALATEPDQDPAPAQETTTPSEEPPAPTEKSVAQMGDKSYESVTKALEDLGETTEATITLLDDTAEDITVAEGKTITLDLGGSTITNKSGHTITNNGTLTITGDGTVDNVTHAKAALYNNGTVTVEGGAYTRSNENSGSNSWYVVYNAKNAKMDMTGGKVAGTSTYSSAFINHGTLTISGGEVESKMIAVKNDETGTLTISGGTITDNADPENQAVQNWCKATITGGDINGRITSWSYTNNAQLFAGNYDISGGTIRGDVFIATYTGTSFDKVLPEIKISDGAAITGDVGFYVNTSNSTADANGTKGKFTITGGEISGTVSTKSVPLTGGEQTETGGTIEITGGTFTADPADYVTDGYMAVEDGGSYVVKTFAEGLSATLDVSKSGGITAGGSGKAFTLSGNVDMSKYTVTDSELKTLFFDLLAKERKTTEMLADEERTIETMYVKGGLDLVFAILKFEGLSETGNYYVKQTNPGLDVGYPDAFEGNVKGKVYSGKDISDGLAFIVPTGQNTIKFEIAPCEANASELPGGAATITVTSNVTLADAEPEAGTVVVPPTVTGTDDNKSTAAKVEDSKVGTVTENSTLTVDATVSTSIDENVKKSEVTLEKAVVDKLDTANATVVIKTDVATVELPAEAVDKMKDDSTGAVLSVEKKDASSTAGVSEIFEVKVVKTDASSTKVEIKELTDPITLSFYIGKDRKDNPELFFYDEGKYVPVDGSSYDDVTGYVTGTTNHLSEYRIRTADETKDGLGRQITVYAEQNQFVAVQVSRNGTNAIFSVKVTESSGAFTFTAPTGSVVSYWVTSAAPKFDGTGITNSATEIVQGQTFVGAKN